MQLTKFKKLLQSQKEEITLFIKNHPADVDFDGDETDEIQAKIIARTAAEILARKRERLQKIDMAIKKIDDGKYGDCEECSDPIAEKRLLFNPGFNTCISCAEGLEALKKSRAR